MKSTPPTHSAEPAFPEIPLNPVVPVRLQHGQAAKVDALVARLVDHAADQFVAKERHHAAAALHALEHLLAEARPQHGRDRRQLALGRLAQCQRD